MTDGRGGGHVRTVRLYHRHSPSRMNGNFVSVVGLIVVVVKQFCGKMNAATDTPNSTQLPGDDNTIPCHSTYMEWSFIVPIEWNG